MSSTLALAASLAAMDRHTLRELLARRKVASLDALSNPLGLAIELLRPDAVAATLRHQNRGSIAALVEFGDGGEVQDQREVDYLRGLGLLGVDSRTSRSVALAEVTAALREFEVAELLEFGPDSGAARPTGGGSAAEASTSPTVRVASGGSDVEPADTSAWFGPALAATVRAAALLRALRSRPARLSRKGAVTVVALRELALVTHDAPEATGRLLSLLRFAGLAVPFSVRGSVATLIPSPDAAAWLELPQADRWVRLAAALAAESSAHVRRALELSRGDLREAVDRRLAEEYPLLPERFLTEAADWADLAEQVGMSVGGLLTPTGQRLVQSAAGPLSASEAARAAALADAERDFPATARGVYLQPDLSVIVPGPLAPVDERMLGLLAETEQLGVASTLRVSPATLHRGLRAGIGVAEIRSFLERLSLTGIPQPLDFMLSDLERQPSFARREESFGSAWVERHQGDFDGSGVGAGAGHPLPHPQAGAAGGAAPSDPELDALAEAREAAVDRILDAARASSGTGDLTHRLELAIRDRQAVRVTAMGPEERTFVLLPVALVGGRLRATDQAAGVERTLPITAITEIEPV